MTLLAPPERKARSLTMPHGFVTVDEGAVDQKIRIVGYYDWLDQPHYYWLTPRQLDAFYDASAKKREWLYVQERKRGPIMTDAAAERIASGMRAWSERWLQRISR